MKAVASVALRNAWLVLAIALLPGCGPTRPVVRDAATAPSGTPVVTRPPAWYSIGHSAMRRPLLASQRGSGPLRIYLIGGVHGDETEGARAIENLAQAHPQAATIRILRDLNPDGTAARDRLNARGVDLNRNWPASNFSASATGGPVALSEIETRTLAGDLRAFRPHLVIALHSIATGPLVNYDGPAGEMAAAFAHAARSVDSGWRVVPELGYPTPGSLGSYLGVDQDIPILTIEFQRGQDPASAQAALDHGLAAVIRVAGARQR